MEPIKVSKFPLLSEEGWPRQQIKCREATSNGAAGVVMQFRRNFIEVDHHHYWLRAIALAFAPLIPVCAAKDAALLFLDRAATPPRRVGESSPPRHLGNMHEQPWLCSIAAPRLKSRVIYGH